MVFSSLQVGGTVLPALVVASLHPYVSSLTVANVYLAVYAGRSIGGSDDGTVSVEHRTAVSLSTLICEGSLETS